MMPISYESCPVQCGEDNGCEQCNPVWPDVEEDF